MIYIYVCLYVPQGGCRRSGSEDSKCAQAKLGLTLCYRPVKFVDDEGDDDRYLYSSTRSIEEEGTEKG